MRTDGAPDAGRTLRDLAVGESAVLGELRLEANQRMRLAELGMRPGERVTMMQHSIAGARVIAVHGSRIALDAQTLQQLTVRTEGES